MLKPSISQRKHPSCVFNTIRKSMSVCLDHLVSNSYILNQIQKLLEMSHYRVTTGNKHPCFVV